jgi:hypothetical protein
MNAASSVAIWSVARKPTQSAEVDSLIGTDQSLLEKVISKNLPRPESIG